MMWSANEVMALAAKAARGGGAPAAQAAEFGCAALCHLIASRSEEDIVKALDALPLGVILAAAPAFGQVFENAQGDVASGDIYVEENAELMLSYAEALPFAGTRRLNGGKITLRLSLNTPAKSAAVARVTISEGLARKMQALAARTFVPESDASRLAGAGAGLSDND